MPATPLPAEQETELLKVITRSIRNAREIDMSEDDAERLAWVVYNGMLNAPAMDDASMQAECVVRALDDYLATFPWPLPTVQSASSISVGNQAGTRMILVKTIAASIRMSEPRKSPLQT